MKIRIIHLQKIFLLLAAIVLGAGCIKEDLEDCKTPTTLHFTYLADGNQNVLPHYIHKIDLYVFDSSNRLVEKFTYGQDELADQTKGHTFRLKKGKHTLVAVGNAYNRTRMVNMDQADFGRMYLQHPDWNSGLDITDGHDDNYLGKLEIDVPEFDGTGIEHTVQLFSTHINVSVEIKGLAHLAPAATRAAPGVKLSFEKANAQTNVLNQVSTTSKEICQPALVYDAEKQLYHTEGLSLFRIDKEGLLEKTLCEHVLILTDLAGKELYRSNIYEYILSHPEHIDVTKQEALLPIEIEFTAVGVEIKVPGWVIVDGQPEWN